MRYHPRSRTVERQQVDSEHNLIHFNDFVDVLRPKLEQKQFQPASESDLIRALKTLDQQNRSCLHKKVFVQILSTSEETLEPNESETLRHFLAESSTLNDEHSDDYFNYRKYVRHLLPWRHQIFLDLDKKS